MTITLSPRAPELTGEANMGAPIDRVEGPLKVSGLATYAYEYRGIGETAYGFIVGSTISKGRMVSIDVSAAERAPGVLLVLTHKNAPPQGTEEVVPKIFLSPTKPYLTSDAVRYRGEPIAFIVADSFENARAAGSLVRVEYESDEDGAFDLAEHQGEAYKPENMFGRPTDSIIGDVDAAMAAADVTIDTFYSTPYQHHNAMEPHSTLAVWEGERVTLYSAQQMPKGVQPSIPATLQMPAENIRVLALYVGGGFGGKGMIEADAVLAAMAARELGQPVKVAMTRPQTFVNAGHRPQTLQHIRLGASRDGKLSAVAIESIIQTARYNQFSEPVGSFLRGLYEAPNRVTSHRLVRLDLPAGISMRAPGEAPGMLTFEAAMDELAHVLGIDPIELRVINEPGADPENGKPFSVRLLVECMREGARRFGWENRPKIPASRREGNLLVGYGMAAAIRSNFLVPNQAKVRLDTDGTATVQTATTDIGTGTYTILAQIAAAEFGLPVSKVKVEIGDSDLPYSVGSGGSFGAASAGSAVFEACRALRQKLAEIATGDQDSPLRGANSAEAAFRDGVIIMGGAQEPLADFIARNAPEGIEADGAIGPTPAMQNYSQHGYGAHFAEVTVDADTGEIRLRRMTSVFEAGRILNAKTARSQMIGGLIWGIGSALHEEAIVDNKLGLFINHDLASYHVPAHADVPELDVTFLDAYDDKANPLGIKGVGELGIAGAGAAIANAVFNATGIRVREYPITLDKLLDQLPG